MRKFRFFWNDTVTGETTIRAETLEEAKIQFDELSIEELHSKSVTHFDGEGFKVQYVKEGDEYVIENWEAEERAEIENIKEQIRSGKIK